MLFDYLCIEKCRICHALIAAQFSQAKTVCNTCWAPLAAEQARLDLCAVSIGCGITVAHAVAYEKAIKTLIYRLKYDQLLHKAFCKLLAEIDTAIPSILVPIPLSRWRQIKRGFNQSELLARQICIAEKTGTGRTTNLNSRLLRRQKHTKPQHKLNRNDRAMNLQEAFKCRGNTATGREANIILVDDIHTSGSTLAEAARCLQASGWQNIFAITVARANLNQHNDLGF